MPFPGRLASREREPEVEDRTKTASSSRTGNATTSKGKSSTDVEPSEKKTSSAERPPAIADRSAPSSRKIDPATQMLIDSELKDLPPDERQQWKNYLASVETAEIPNVLQKRAEGVIPPELESSSGALTKSSNEDQTQLASKKLMPKKSPLDQNSLIEGDVDAPTPEIRLSSAEKIGRAHV